jgi:hypothetical protein
MLRSSSRRGHDVDINFEPVQTELDVLLQAFRTFSTPRRTLRPLGGAAPPARSHDGDATCQKETVRCWWFKLSNGTPHQLLSLFELLNFGTTRQLFVYTGSIGDADQRHSSLRRGSSCQPRYTHLV